MDTWRLDPAPHWFENSAANLPAGTLEMHEPPYWDSQTAHVLRGADNEATRIAGFSVDGINVGDVRILRNNSVSGLDSGGIVLLNAANVKTPNGDACLISYESGAAIYYDEDEYWHVLWGCHSWMQRLKAQSVNLYPTCIVTVAAGTHHDWNPTCETSYALGGLAGGSLQLKDYATVVATVDAAGAKLTGIGSITGGNHDPADHGQLKILWNNGPGPLELALEAGSSPGLAMTLPNSITLRAKEGAILFSPGSDLVTDHRWHAIGLAQGDVRDRVQALSLVASVAELEAVRMTGRVTPAAMSASLISAWDPVDATTGKSFHKAYHLRLQGGVGTILCGFAAGVQGERHLLTNYASDYLIRSDCTSAAAADRIAIPGGGDRIHRYRGHFEIQYDTQWMLLVP